MKAKIFAALAIMTAVAALGSKVQAQSLDSNTGKQRITGDSLTGIHNRTAEDDFAKFFAVDSFENILMENIGQNVAPSDVWQISEQYQLRSNEGLSIQNDLIFSQPYQSFNGNDGVQVQLDLERIGNDRK